MKLLIVVVLVSATGVLPREKQYRISGGMDARPTDFKFQVQIVPKKDVNSKTTGLCGGSLIHNNWVLTSAHCFDIGKVTEVYLGLNEKYIYTTVINAIKVIIHESYFQNLTHLINDIALVNIPDVKYGKYIERIQLSSETLLVGRFVIVAGWGLTANRTLPTKLQYTPLIVLSNIECKMRFGDHFSDNQFCTYDSARYTCPVDEGNPAFIGVNAVPIQVGLVSYGLTDCSSHSSNANTLVAAYLPWIRNKTNIHF